MYNEAMRGRMNEEVAILAIEFGGRMHSQFHRLITVFAKFKADKIAGPLPVDRTRQGLGFDNRTDLAVKAHKAIYVRTKSCHGQDASRTSQEHRGKDHAYYNSAPQMHQK